MLWWSCQTQQVWRLQALSWTGALGLPVLENDYNFRNYYDFLIHDAQIIIQVFFSSSCHVWPSPALWSILIALTRSKTSLSSIRTSFYSADPCGLWSTSTENTIINKRTICGSFSNHYVQWFITIFAIYSCVLSSLVINAIFTHPKTNDYFRVWMYW
jgi:hypothetical protein